MGNGKHKIYETRFILLTKKIKHDQLTKYNNTNETNTNVTFTIPQMKENALVT